jgi:hypothetical protein
MSTIRPTQPGQTPQSGAGQLKGAGSSSPARADEKPAEAPSQPAAAQDSVQLSQTVRELQERLGLEAIPSGTLSPERLKEIVSRVADGHYDRPEVIAELARRLTGELGSDPSRG